MSRFSIHTHQRRKLHEIRQREDGYRRHGGRHRQATEGAPASPRLPWTTAWQHGLQAQTLCGMLGSAWLLSGTVSRSA